MKTGPFIVITTWLALVTGCSHSITGMITDTTGEPVSVHGKINIIRLGGDNRTTDIVDIETDGSFTSQEDLEPGEYLVEPLIPGYEHGSAKVNLDGSQFLKFTVKKIPQEKATLIQDNQFIRVGRGSGDVNLTPPKY